MDRETARLAALRDAAILDTASEEAFDDIADLARALTGASSALVSLVDGERQWFKARRGYDTIETPRADALCDRVVEAAAALFTLDAARDPRFATSALVTGPPHIRFYAGAPILADGDHAIGTVCVFDPVPREGFDGLDSLVMLARQATALIGLRRLSSARSANHEATVREFESLWALAHDLLIVCDADGAVIAANPAWTKIFGPLASSRAVRMVDFLADPAQRPDVASIVDGETRGFVVDYRGVDSELRTIGWTLRREGELLYGIGRDDTALRSVERDLAQAQRMEALGQLTGGIAHDFNNLLTIVIGNLDIATRRLRLGDTARVERAIADAGDGASRATALTQRLLAFARRQRLAPRAIDPSRLLADMAPLIERVVGDTVAVVTRSAADLWPVEVDVGQLENALLNLAANARDAMAGELGDGLLTVSAVNSAVGSGEAARNGGQAGDHVRFSVADTGTGMAADVLGRALEPFFTTKGIGRGTGLGLSQVDGFVRQSGGFVTIESVAGEGTAVHLWLPRTGVAVSSVEPAPAGGTDAAPSRSACVMVVEDSDDLRELVVETLREGGYRVIEAHDGRAALSLFARQPVRPDLVLSDVMMPGIDGFALAAEIRARSAATRVLLMTGYAPDERDWAEPMLVKPFTPSALLGRVSEMLGDALADAAARMPDAGP